MEQSMNEMGTAEGFPSFPNSLKNLLADEYIVMNKIASCLNNTSPFYASTASLFSDVYGLLKLNIGDLLEILKTHSLKNSVNINVILQNARLENNVNFQSKALLIQSFVLDDEFIVSCIDNEIIVKHEIIDNDDTKRLLEIKERHLEIIRLLAAYLKKMFTHNPALS